MQVDAGLGYNEQSDLFRAFGDVTVGHIVAPGLGRTVRLDGTLREGAMVLNASGRGAVAISDDHGSLVGLITENDILRCYFEGVLPQQQLAVWLQSGLARAPGALFQRLSVSPEERLAAVAEKMVKNAIAGDCACHHVLVQESQEDGSLGRHAVLSALDIVHGIWRAGKDLEYNPLFHHIGVETCVAEVMKPQEGVFTCAPRETLRDVLKVLLTTQQNSVLVVDEDGIEGLVTPRDLTKAFLDSVPLDMLVRDWLRSAELGVSSRVIPATSSVCDAAALMVARTLNHLVVTDPNAPRFAVGLVSAFDLALHASKTKLPAVWKECLHQETGPLVGSIVSQNWHLQAVCEPGSSLAAACEVLASANRTSAAVATAQGVTLLVDTELMRAYVEGWSGQTPIVDLLARDAFRPAIMPLVMVPPSLHLTEAAARMLESCHWRSEACRHIIVKGTGPTWDGVFSALDVARALHCMGTELDRTKLGLHQLKVVMVMRPSDSVPFCKPHDTLKDAFHALLTSRQHALFVVDQLGNYMGLVTPRCALRAFAEHVPLDTTVGTWLKSHPNDEPPREVSMNTPLTEATAMMTERCLHHLVVKEPGAFQAQGILSALDIVRGVVAARSARPFTSLGWLSACKGPNSNAIWAV